MSLIQVFLVALLPSSCRPARDGSALFRARPVPAAVLAALSCFSAPAPISAHQAAPRPYFEARKQQAEFNGPGREEGDPEGLTEVRIGYFGPEDPRHPEGGDIWTAVNLALDEANAEGGYRGLPFRLIPGWSENPWGSGVAQVARMAYEDEVWAVIGGIDGPSTHLAEQVAAKARLPLISPAATDKTVNLANVPWMFSAVPGDHALAPILASALARRAAPGGFTLAAATDHDSHLFLVELEKHLARRHLIPACRLEFEQGRISQPKLARQLLESRPATVVLIAGARDSVSLLNELRSAGFKGGVIGGPAMGRRAFYDRIREADGALLFPLLQPDSGNSAAFQRVFRQRAGWPPDFAAAHGYESARILVAAIRRAGLNRARIGDALRGLSPWNGAAVRIEWDPLGQNRRAVALGTTIGGRPAPAQGRPR